MEQSEDLWSVDGGTFETLDRVDRQGLLLPMQLEAEFVQNREDGGETGEVHVSITIWRRRGQSHRKPTLCVHSEQAAEICAVHGWKIGPVFDVLGEVVHTDGVRVQGMTESDDKRMAAVRRCIEDAIFRGDC